MLLLLPYINFNGCVHNVNCLLHLYIQTKITKICKKWLNVQKSNNHGSSSRRNTM